MESRYSWVAVNPEGLGSSAKREKGGWWKAANWNGFLWRFPRHSPESLVFKGFISSYGERIRGCSYSTPQVNTSLLCSGAPEAEPGLSGHHIALPTDGHCCLSLPAWHLTAAKAGMALYGHRAFQADGWAQELYQGAATCSQAGPRASLVTCHQPALCPMCYSLYSPHCICKQKSFGCFLSLKVKLYIKCCIVFLLSSGVCNPEASFQTLPL